MDLAREVHLSPYRRLDGSFSPPGDKSITHRALLLAMINRGTATLSGLLRAADTLATLAAVRSILTVNSNGLLESSPHEGATRTPDFQLLVQSPGRTALAARPPRIEVGNSGTTIRLLAGILAAGSSGDPAVLTGDDSIRRRPMARVIEPLQAMGAHIRCLEGDGAAPFEVVGAQLRGISYDLPLASAQVKSCLILAGIAAEGESVLTEPGPSRDHTERMLRAMGAPLGGDKNRLIVEATDLSGDWSMHVPGDISSAASLLVTAAILPGSRVTARGVGINPTRDGILDILRSYGAMVLLENETEEGGEPRADVTVSAGDRRPVEVGGELVVRAIDELPLVAALGAFAEGTTIVTDAGELRVKESDRVAATVAAARAMGVEATATPDGFEIQGRGGHGVSGGEVDARGDHRIAMLGAVLASAASEGSTIIRGWDSIGISYPGFGDDLAALGVA